MKSSAQIIEEREQKRQRGRPRAEEPSTGISTWVPNATAEKLYELARKHDVKVSALVRELLHLQLRRP